MSTSYGFACETEQLGDPSDVGTLQLKCTCQQSFSSFYNAESLSDVTLRIDEGDGKSFACHKLALSSASPVFKAMFESGMAEAQHKTTVTIQGTSQEVLELLLQFIYGIEVDLPMKRVVDFFQLADQFQVEAACDMLLQLLKPPSGVAGSDYDSDNEDAVITPAQLSKLVPQAARSASLEKLKKCLAQHAAQCLLELTWQPEFLANWSAAEVLLVIECAKDWRESEDSDLDDDDVTESGVYKCFVAAAQWAICISSRVEEWPQLMGCLDLSKLTQGELAKLRDEPWLEDCMRLPGVAVALFNSALDLGYEIENELRYNRHRIPAARKSNVVYSRSKRYKPEC